MKKLSVMSINFSPNSLNSCAKRKIANNERNLLKIVTNYINENDFDILLFQGKDAIENGKIIEKGGDYQMFPEANSPSAILLKSKIPIANWFNIPGIGNIVVIPTIYHYMSIFSVSLTKKKQLNKFLKEFQKFTTPASEYFTELQIAAGNFPSKGTINSISKDKRLTDAALSINSACEELEKDKYTILLSKGITFSNPPHRQIGLVKKKYIKHCPIAMNIEYKN